jgi:hypothetical protein
MNTTTVPYTFERKGFLIKWLLTDTLGLVVGPFAALFLSYGVMSLIPGLNLKVDIIVALLLLIAVWIFSVNMLTGFGEQLVVKRHLKANITWFRASAIGAVLCALLCAIPGIIAWYLMMGWARFESPPVVLSLMLGILFLLLFGLFPGLLQWCALRKIIPHASLWIWVKFLVSIGLLMGWFCAIFLFLIMIFGVAQNNGLSISSTLSLLFFFVFLPTLILGAVSGAIYGAVMRKLLEEPAVEPLDCEFSEFIWKF